MPQHPVIGTPQHRSRCRDSWRERTPRRHDANWKGDEESEDKKILLRAATHGVTGTYDWSAQSVTMCRTLEISGGRGEQRVAGGESTRARLQYLSAAESGGRQPRIRHDLTDPLLLDPHTQWIRRWAAQASSSDLTRLLSTGCGCIRSRPSERTGAATTSDRDAATSGGVD